MTKKPATITEAVKAMTAEKLSDEDANALFGEEEPKYLPGDPRYKGEAAEDDAGPEPDLPSWVKVPPGFKFPKGKQVSFLRFRAEWTDTPSDGDRVCIMWNLNSADEKLAITRTRGDSLKLVTELTKQMIRAVDGHKADWSGKGGAGSVDRWYDMVGAKCRQLVQNHYLKMHSMTSEERTDFFENCIVVRTAG